MIIITPTAGVSSQYGFAYKLISYFACMPMYFLIAIIFLVAFSNTNKNDIEIRTMQLLMASIIALILAIAHNLIQRLVQNTHFYREVTTIQWKEIYQTSGICISLICIMIIL